ncbi:MAG: 3-dehydroquinate dehydratase [Pseudolabrys sp.]|nr:3-dehydroquinate dehydratase [Pseudolabrys sp.]MBV9259775.1 3-dehydroquinate dehydratase [Pseudolabrys sp.]
MRRTIHVLNGPNLNMLGVREPHIYGTTTLKQLEERCTKHARKAGIGASFFQSNDESELIELIQKARAKADAIVLNPAAFSFTSIAILDALNTFEGPIIEVHISNIHRRDELHRHSIISTAVTAVIAGLGVQGYIAAIDAIAAMPADKFGKK